MMNHKKFRALLKKFRRKFKRQAISKIREQERQNEQPNEVEEDSEQLAIELENEEKERERQHLLWLQREAEAQEQFCKRKEMEEARKKNEEEIRKQKENLLLQQNENAVEMSKEEKIKALKDSIQDEGAWHNPIASENYKVQTKEACSFYMKTGSCRFGDCCSRSHPRPDVSCTLLIKGMYSHFSIEQMNCDDYDADCNLEYEDNETYLHFCDFYDDVLPEFKKVGKVIQFKVCCNHEPHLRGNVYIQYSIKEEAQEAYRLFNSRYYGGKQLTCEFSNVTKWKSAICGLFHRNSCPKGSSCNFLHVFKNPNNEFWAADRDLEERRDRRRYNDSHRSNSYRNRHRHYSPISDRRRKRYRRSSSYNRERYRRSSSSSSSDKEQYRRSSSSSDREQHLRSLSSSSSSSDSRHKKSSSSRSSSSDERRHKRSKKKSRKRTKHSFKKRKANNDFRRHSSIKSKRSKRNH